MVELWEWVLLGILLIMSSFFSGSETALMSLNKLRVHHLVQKQVPNAILVDKLLSTPNKLLSTILIGNNVINIGASALSTSIALRLYGSAGVGISVGVLTVLILIFGEITPKTYAAANNEKFSLKISPIIIWVEILFRPAVKLLDIITGFIIKALGTKPNSNKLIVTEEEIRTMVDLGKDQGAIEVNEMEMITNVFELDDRFVREVMVPRIDIISVPAELGLEEAWGIVIETNHSRIPVFKNSIDDIVGILYAKDLMKNHNNLKNTDVKSIMRKAHFVPETKTVSQLMIKMRRERSHIAVVLDEYGGTAGLVFLEDLIETIVGTIGDEYDDVKKLIEEIGQDEYLVSGRLAVEKVNSLTDLDLPEDEHETIGGLVFHIFGHIPNKGETIEFSNGSFTIDDVEKNKIKKIHIKVHNKNKE